MFYIFVTILAVTVSGSWKSDAFSSAVVKPDLIYTKFITIKPNEGSSLESQDDLEVAESVQNVAYGLPSTTYGPPSLSQSYLPPINDQKTLSDSAIPVATPAYKSSGRLSGDSVLRFKDAENRDQLAFAPPTFINPKVAPSANDLYGRCSNGYERSLYGTCVRPRVSKDIFLYKAPSFKVNHKKVHYDHKPKVHYNMVFLQTPRYSEEKLKPIVVPPPKQKTLVYLLSQRPDNYEQEVIEVPLEPTKPEVFFVDYKDGENPRLPGGIDLRTALAQSASAGLYDSNFDDASFGLPDKIPNSLQLPSSAYSSVSRTGAAVPLSNPLFNAQYSPDNYGLYENRNFIQALQPIELKY